MPSLMQAGRLAYALARGRALPFSMGFILTNRCNFRCVYCDIPEHAGDEMSVEEFRGAIDEFADCGMARAGFSGGEVSLRPEVVPIVRHARERGLFTSMNTNAWLPEPLADELLGLLDMLVISLDGPEPVHDTVRRRRGSHARVLELIERARGRGVALATITVLGPWNLEHIDEILALAAEKGFYAYFQPAYESCLDHQTGLHPVFHPELLDRIATHLTDARRAGLPLGSSPGYLERLRRGPSFGDCGTCKAGRYFATVLPDGRVVPCHLTSGQAQYLDGRKVGFRRAFFDMPHPESGPGCAVTPLQESDLIFGLDGSALANAARQILAARFRRTG